MSITPEDSRALAQSQIVRASSDLDAARARLERNIPGDAANPLDALGHLHAATETLARATVEAVLLARHQGRSWSAIASVLGVSRQAVQKRFDFYPELAPEGDPETEKK